MNDMLGFFMTEKQLRFWYQTFQSKLGPTKSPKVNITPSMVHRTAGRLKTGRDWSGSTSMYFAHLRPSNHSSLGVVGASSQLMPSSGYQKQCQNLPEDCRTKDGLSLIIYTNKWASFRWIYDCVSLIRPPLCFLMCSMILMWKWGLALGCFLKACRPWGLKHDTTCFGTAPDSAVVPGQLFKWWINESPTCKCQGYRYASHRCDTVKTLHIGNLRTLLKSWDFYSILFCSTRGYYNIISKMFPNTRLVGFNFTRWTSSVQGWNRWLSCLGARVVLGVWDQKLQWRLVDVVWQVRLHSAQFAQLQLDTCGFTIQNLKIRLQRQRSGECMRLPPEM